MELLQIINEYAQLINFVLFVAIIGWLIRISMISRTALTDKYDADLASKDTKIALLEKTSEILQLQLESLEKDRDRLKSEISEAKVDPNGLLASLEIIKRRADAQVEETQKELKSLIADFQLKEQELEKLQTLNNKLMEETTTREEIFGSMLSTIHHQGRVCLTNIIGLAQLFFTKEKIKLSPKTKDDLIQKIIQYSEELVKILEVLVDSSILIEPKLIEPKFLTVSLLDIIQDVLKNLEDKILDKKIIIELVGLEKLPKVSVNINTFQNAISNIIDNSIFASENKGKIKIIGKTKSQSVELTFQDFGTGISETFKETIFSGFISSESRKTGVGLLITKQLLKYNSGHVTVSNLNNPTELKVLLPIKN